MAKTPRRQMVSLYNEDEKNGTIETQLIDVPFTSIQNRAKIIDLENDLGMRMGIERIPIGMLQPCPKEVDVVNKKIVHKDSADKFDRIRYVGSWYYLANDRSSSFSGQQLDDYVEVTFYGTGLNMLTIVDGNTGATDYRVSIDGGPEGSNVFIDGLNSNAAQKYRANTVVKIASGLTLGLHTVKIRLNSSATYFLNVFGFEILNDRSDILVNAGKTFVNNLELNHESESISYNSEFANEYGTAGTKGGHVITYLDELGQVKKDIQWVDTAAKYLTNADHSNEEVIQRYHFREFGSEREVAGDDFTTLHGTTTDAAFTLDDGTTNLLGDNVDDASNPEMLTCRSGGRFVFTFVGTGLAIDITDGDAVSSGVIGTINIDGVAVGDFSRPGAGETFEICSGLPYGTHTVAIVSSSNSGFLSHFIVYGPKKPEYPEKCTRIGSYFLMSDFVANTFSSRDSISQGVLRKQQDREFTLVGANWSYDTVTPVFIGGRERVTNGNGNYLEYTFFGTGFDFRWSAGSNRSNNITISVDGSSDLSSYTTSLYGDFGSWTAATGQLSQNGSTDYGQGLIVSGLPLGMHTIRFTNNTTNYLVVEAIDIITPIHTRKFVTQNVYQQSVNVGSCLIKDERSIDNIKDGKIAINNRLKDGSTISIPYRPYWSTVPEGYVTLHLEEEKTIEVSYNVTSYNNTSFAYNRFKVTVNNIYVESSVTLYRQSNGNEMSQIGATSYVKLGPGTHFIRLEYQTVTSGTTFLLYSNYCFINVREV